MLLLENENHEKTTITEYLKSIFIMPRLMQMLCVTNLLSWMAFVSYCLYFTDFVGEAVFMGDPMVNTKRYLTLYIACNFLLLIFFACRLYQIQKVLDSIKQVFDSDVGVWQFTLFLVQYTQCL